MRLDTPPYAPPTSPVKRTSGYGCGSKDSASAGLGAKRPGPCAMASLSANGRPRPGPARVQVRIPGRGLSSVFRVSYLPLLYFSNTLCHPCYRVVYDLIDLGSKRKLLTRRPGRPMALTKLSWPIHLMVLSFPNSSSSSTFRSSPSGTCTGLFASTTQA